MSPKIASILVLFASALLSPHAALADGYYNFDTDAVGKTTPFVDATGTLLATFSGPVPNAFIVQALPVRSPYLYLGGNVLTTNEAAGITNQPLTIAITTSMFRSLSFYFIVDSPNQVPLTVNAFSSDGTLIGSDTELEYHLEMGRTVGTSLEGFVNLHASAPISSVVISTSAPGFSLDNVSFTPEPASLFLVGFSSLALLLFGRRYSGEASSLDSD